MTFTNCSNKIINLQWSKCFSASNTKMFVTYNSCFFSVPTVSWPQMADKLLSNSSLKKKTMTHSCSVSLLQLFLSFKQKHSTHSQFIAQTQLQTITHHPHTHNYFNFSCPIESQLLTMSTIFTHNLYGVSAATVSQLQAKKLVTQSLTIHTVSVLHPFPSFYSQFIVLLYSNCS